MFKLSNTWPQPLADAGTQRGFPASGSGQQTTGGPSQPAGSNDANIWAPYWPTKGRRTWGNPTSPSGEQRGFPNPLSWLQRRPPGSMPATQTPDGLAHPVETPYFSRGAAAYVQNYGKVLVNPIGAGIVARHRPHASYGVAGQYVNGAIWWTSQAIPTSINLQGLADPEALANVIDPIYLEGVVRVT